MKLYQAIAQNHRLIGSELHGMVAENRHARIMQFLPHGSGFDKGTEIEACDDKRIVFSTSFHHMDENGFYDGWTEHKVTIHASLTVEISVAVSGINKRGIKDYIADVFSELMYREFKWIDAEDSKE